MPSKKQKNSIKENIALSMRLPQYAGYADCCLGTPVYFQLTSTLAETVTLRITAESGEGLIVPYEATAEVPFESSVSLSAELFSPLFLAENDELRVCSVEVVVSCGGGEALRERAEITALPYDWWEGIEGNAERLSAFVRPRLSDCARVLEDAGKRLKRWNVSSEFYGYAGTDKNAVRQIAAAIFAAVKSFSLERSGPCELSAPVRVAGEPILKNRAAGAPELAVFAAACLEAARLHPVIAVGKNEIAVGVWLYESCFLDTVTDDGEIVSKYVSDGINNLSFFDADDLFVHSNAAFTAAEKHFAQKLGAGMYEYFVDIRRCRLGGIRPLPLRGKGLRGYELLKEEDTGAEEAPAPLPSFQKIRLDGQQPKNKQWERRLLDLTGKNALLNFTGKNALHLAAPDADETYNAVLQKDGLRIRGGTDTAEPFGVSYSAPMRELISLEQRKGIVRAYTDPKTAAEVCLRLQKRNREADEESGAKILYLACGFLRYTEKSGEEKHAPLVLTSAALMRGKGNESFVLRCPENEYFVNSTLLELLKQEFNIDVRGLGGDVSQLKIAEILAMFRAETAAMKGWEVTGDVYLAAFSFQNYLMWNDIRRNIDELKKNRLVSALLTGRAERTERAEGGAAEEDEGGYDDVLLPLPSDSSQYGAVALSASGASFVLHGPPGTGKSQTITNIIANVLSSGKRVLFVAEKKAALDVVKKRLDGIGVGEFCLELHSNKTDKTDVLKRIDATLSLTGGADVSLSGHAEELVNLREELRRPMEALHRKRRLGVSVYQAILFYLQNKNAPDILNIESSFYDSLTEAKLIKCRNSILSAAAAAKECGGVYGSPFENVNLEEYSQELRDRLYCSCEVVLAEIRHVKSFLALLLEFYRQRVSAFTERKLKTICRIAEGLLGGRYLKYFSGVKEDEFCVFFNANKQLDYRLSYYGKHFKSLVDPETDADELQRLVEEGNWKTSKDMRALVRRLQKAAVHELSEEDIPKYLQTLAEIYSAKRRIVSNTALSARFLDRAGRIVFKKRKEFLADLYELHELCASVFLDYAPDAFNGMCIRAANGYTAPVLEGYLKAAEGFFRARDGFISVTKAEKTYREEDILEYYSAKAGALIDNIDMLPNWCMYRATTRDLASLGLTFIADALESGRLKGENVLAGFEKNIYRNFLELNISSDPALSLLSVGTLEETIEKFRLGWEEYGRLTREHIRAQLLSRVPARDGEGPLSVEIAAFTRLSKSNLRGTGLRALFTEAPELMARVCPCMLMSPTTVAQYLPAQADLFDLVIFDEASQMSTAEAVGSIARARAAIVVGDPKQLPPTAFFHTAFDDAEEENVDLESVLDDCLALGIPERHLLWHYRSKHESLIAFSNCMYYDNRLCTFPSPDGPESKVRLVEVEGTYDRGFTKRNRKEAEALVKEVVRRLQDPVLNRSSMGVVTFSGAQQEDIERLLQKEISQKKLEGAAYDREEPLFVKNLENVQGDERDVILFSVCYGPDRTGRVSLNFGPLNQAGGWRRLNVAVSRAREEMIVFSTMTSAMIDLRRTTSKGVEGLKAFLEFAERGRTTLAVKSSSVKGGAGIGKYIAAELAACGYECRYDVGASDFKVDVAVIDPANKHRFVLGILCDGTDLFSVKDRNVLQVQALKRGNWNVMRVNSVNYFNNPKREIKRVKDMLDRLTGAEKRGDGWLNKYRKPYKWVKPSASENAAFITCGEHDAAVMARIKEIVAQEEPISRAFLKKRCLASFGIQKSGSKVDSRLDELISACALNKDRAMGTDYYYKNARAIALGKFRLETEGLRKSEEDFTVYEAVSLVKGALEEKVALYMDEIAALAAGTFGVRLSDKFVSFVRDCVAYGEEKGLFVRSVSDRVSLA